MSQKENNKTYKPPRFHIHHESLYVEISHKKMGVIKSKEVKISIVFTDSFYLYVSRKAKIMKNKNTHGVP